MFRRAAEPAPADGSGNTPDTRRGLPPWYSSSPPRGPRRRSRRGGRVLLPYCTTMATDTADRPHDPRQTLIGQPLSPAGAARTRGAGRDGAGRGRRGPLSWATPSPQTARGGPRLLTAPAALGRRTPTVPMGEPGPAEPWGPTRPDREDPCKGLPGLWGPAPPPPPPPPRGRTPCTDSGGGRGVPENTLKEPLRVPRVRVDRA